MLRAIGFIGLSGSWNENNNRLKMCDMNRKMCDMNTNISQSVVNGLNAQVQTFIQIPKEQWDEIVKLLEDVKKMLEPKDRWLSKAEAIKELGISATTWYDWCRRYEIPFSRIGRKVMVKQSVLDEVRERRAKERDWY